MGYSPWGQKESDMTERLSTHTHTHAPAKYCHKPFTFFNSFNLHYEQ